MEEKKEFLQEWTIEDNFEKPINKKSKNKLLNKKIKRKTSEEILDKKAAHKDTFEKDSEININENLDEINGVIIEDAADLTEEQKLKSKFYLLNYNFSIINFLE